VIEESDAIDAADRQGRARIILRSCGVAAAIIFFVVLIARIHQTPGVEGIFAGFCLGLFAALLVGACGAWTARSLTDPKSTSSIDVKTADELVAALRPVLVELEAARVGVVRQVNARAMTRVPVGAAAGFGLWCLEQLSGRPDRDGIAGVVWNAACLVGVGAMAGYYSAVRDSSAAYARLYLGRVLPLLAARFGDLSFRSPAEINLRELNSDRFFDDYDRAVSDNEFFGAHRGLPISIATLLLTLGSGKQRRVSFEGLLVEVTLPRGLKGTTAVIAGAGAFEQLRRWLKTSNRQHVALEDPRFAAVYDVWSTDQIAARALLTPAFMERLLALSGSAANVDGRPLAVARDNRLTLVIPRYGRDHFRAPGFRKAAASRTSLIALYDQMAGVLAVADAVIDLDSAARAVAAADIPARIPLHA
jgi:Protein of unknown function (DUF3137)